MTVHERVELAVAALESAGFPRDEARRDAATLARFALGWSLADYAAGLRDLSPPGFAEHLTELAAHRATHEPVAYLVGSKEFFGRPFIVTPAVLVPRPETEGIVHEAMRVCPAVASPTVVDVGTGSGCIAVTLALERPEARVIATDVSSGALQIARKNAAALGAAAIEFLKVDADEFIPAGLQHVDLVVSNPPYVPERERDTLSPDVREFEPAGALFGGDDGLDVIRALVPVASARLAPGGAFVMEIGAGQSDAVRSLIGGSGLTLETIRPDLQGIPRIVVARKPVAG